MNKFLPGCLADRLDDLRIAQGLDGKTVAYEAGISESTYSRLKNKGVYSVDPEALIRIAEFHGVTTDFLLGVTDVPERTYFEISELGLSAQAAQRMYEGKLDMDTLNTLLENDDFVELLNTLSLYFTDKLQDTFNLINDNMKFALSLLGSSLAAGEIKDKKDAGETIEIIENSKISLSYEIENIKDKFVKMIENIKLHCQQINADRENRKIFSSEMKTKMYIAGKRISKNWKIPMNKKAELLAKASADALAKNLNKEQREIYEKAFYEILMIEIKNGKTQRAGQHKL